MTDLEHSKHVVIAGEHDLEAQGSNCVPPRITAGAHGGGVERLSRVPPTAFVVAAVSVLVGLTVAYAAREAPVIASSDTRVTASAATPSTSPAGSSSFEIGSFVPVGPSSTEAGSLLEEGPEVPPLSASAELHTRGVSAVLDRG